ncbi:MAG: tRNA (adenosine(37)-N6)-threonylcarbamoyltransferase complex ATPase subunit type 1 TsaE [Candidatus Azambacteria bacterium]|nr:tRNA (adenosine(37)-N6)-threonylcarbamoyltransferase complex ATPase subunit type 1 TsaE [Candidatus Azambacteria bacterium]
MKKLGKKATLYLMVAMSKSPWQTQKIAFDLVKKIINGGMLRNAQVIALEGELGAGKTTFVKGFARALGIKSHITSPTFVLMKRYSISQPKTYLYHIDAYRIKNYRDLISLGIKEIIVSPANIVLIEWSDRVKPILPKKYIKIHIDHIDSKTRKISIQNK